MCFQTAFRTDLQKQYILPQSLRRKVATPPICVMALKSFEKADLDHEYYEIEFYLLKLECHFQCSLQLHPQTEPYLLIFTQIISD